MIPRVKAIVGNPSLFNLHQRTVEQRGELVYAACLSVTFLGGLLSVTWACLLVSGAVYFLLGIW